MMPQQLLEQAPAIAESGAGLTNQLLGLMYGRFAGQLVCLTAKLGLADLIAAEHTSTVALAQALDADPSSLRRFLQALSSCGVLIELEGDRWALAPMGNLLRGDVKGSLRDLGRLFATPEHTQAWLALEHTVLTATPAFDHVFGKDAWAMASESSAFNGAFNAAMSSIAGAVHQAIANINDFSGVRRLVDVGGGHGRLLTAVLRRFQNVRGIVFDMPHVIPGAREYIAEAGLTERCDTSGGDFFESVPVADAYIMTAVLHDWSDEKCISILRNCR